MRPEAAPAGERGHEERRAWRGTGAEQGWGQGGTARLVRGVRQPVRVDQGAHQPLDLRHLRERRERERWRGLIFDGERGSGKRRRSCVDKRPWFAGIQGSRGGGERRGAPAPRWRKTEGRPSGRTRRPPRPLPAAGGGTAAARRREAEWAPSAKPPRLSPPPQQLRRRCRPPPPPAPAPPRLAPHPQSAAHSAHSAHARRAKQRAFSSTETNLSVWRWNSRSAAPGWPGTCTSRRAAAQARAGSTLRARSCRGGGGGVGDGVRWWAGWGVGMVSGRLGGGCGGPGALLASPTRVCICRKASCMCGGGDGGRVSGRARQRVATRDRASPLGRFCRGIPAPGAARARADGGRAGA